jgi:hypothetical protein
MVCTLNRGVEERNPTSRITVPHFRTAFFSSYPESIDRPSIVIRLGNQEFSGEDGGSITEHHVGQTTGRLALMMTSKKPSRRHGIPQPQDREPMAHVLNTQPRRGLTIHAEWIKSQTDHGTEAGNRLWFLSPVRSVHRERVGSAGGSGGTVSPHSDRSSSDEGDENGCDNEADESHQSSIWRQLAGLVRDVIQWMRPCS